MVAAKVGDTVTFKIAGMVMYGEIISIRGSADGRNVLTINAPFEIFDTQVVENFDQDKETE